MKTRDFSLVEFNYLGATFIQAKNDTKIQFELLINSYNSHKIHLKEFGSCINPIR